MFSNSYCLQQIVPNHFCSSTNSATWNLFPFYTHLFPCSAAVTFWDIFSTSYRAKAWTLAAWRSSCSATFLLQFSTSCLSAAECSISASSRFRRDLQEGNSLSLEHCTHYLVIWIHSKNHRGGCLNDTTDVIPKTSLFNLMNSPNLIIQRYEKAVANAYYWFVLLSCQQTQRTTYYGIYCTSMQKEFVKEFLF